MVGYCKCSNKILGSVKCGEFFDQLRTTINFPRRNIIRGVSYKEYGGKMCPV